MMEQDNELKKLVTFLSSVDALPEGDYNLQATQYLSDLLKDYRAPLLSQQLNSIFFTQSLTHAGINSNLGFFPELRQRIKYRLLPPVNEDHFFSHAVTQIFSSGADGKLFEKLSDANWELLLVIADLSPGNEPSLRVQLENAIIILTHQLVTIGIDPYLVKKLPAADDSDSPFFQLNMVVNEYIKKNAPVSVSELMHYLEVCDGIFGYLRENRATLGISLHLTFLIRRAEQHIRRLQLLLRIHAAPERPELVQLLRELATTLIRAEMYRNSLRHFISENTGLLANRVANQTSAKGGDYIGFTKKENNRLLVSAMGGGLVVVFLVYIKHFIHLLHLPLLPEGILFGLNYGIGFVLMHFLHLTLATKQPAMTASYIAESIEQKGLNRESRKELSIILAQIMRSQFISLIGNLLLVLPLCFFSAWLFVKRWNLHVFDRKEAYAYLAGNHPLLSGALGFAVITGMFLTLAGLIAGYYDNKVVFSEIPRRIAHHPVLKKFVKPERLRKFADLIAANLGALMGNLLLGLFLGLAGNLGRFVGLPFDIRHVTISAGNFAISVAQGYGFSKLFMITIFFGVICIGIINIISSFMFSFLIACRSRYLTTRQTWLVLFSMMSYIWKNPGILIFRHDRYEQKL